mmetsp:Transcript_7251/g.9800  ORF Transcript_7251/g.9800 Transcript_7251/m.9800 type:complete len:144 (-) Transcript_7251:170-601(-)
MDEDDDLDFEPTFNKKELQVVSAATPVFSAGVALMKDLIRFLASAPEPPNSAVLSALEEALQGARALMLAGEALGAAMYPPQDRNEIHQHVNAIQMAATSATDAMSCFAHPKGGQETSSPNWSATLEDLSQACVLLGTTIVSI